MTISVRVTRYGKKGLDTSFYSIFESEPTADEPICRIRMIVYYNCI